MFQCLPDPGILADRLRHKVNAPGVQQDAADPDQYVLDHHVSFLAFFGFECPFIVDDAIHDSAADRARESCIDIKNAE